MGQRIARSQVHCAAGCRLRTLQRVTTGIEAVSVFVSVHRREYGQQSALRGLIKQLRSRRASSSVWIDRHRRTTSRRDGPVVDPLTSDAVGSVDDFSAWRSPVLHDHYDPGVEMSLGMIDVW